MAKLAETEVEVPFPLKHTDVEADISGYIATTSVTQQFHNPYEDKIEAEYVFPLPANAAINEFIMAIGDRKIRGIIREREEAEKTYKAAKEQGYIATLLTQQQPNTFKQRVANLEPGKDIDLNIKYFHTLAYADGCYEYSFPMVVGPRFSGPPSRRIRYAPPRERSGRDISLTVNINTGVAIEDVSCPTHAITKSYISPETVAVTLKPLDSIPNKNFILRYKVAGKQIKSALLTHRDERGGFFSLMLCPPDRLSKLRRQPMEIIFVLDCSSGMAGRPIAQVKAAVERALKKLKRDDMFGIIHFSRYETDIVLRDPLYIEPSEPSTHALPSTHAFLGTRATRANVRRALSDLRSLQARGRTTMIQAITAALVLPQDGQRERFIVLLSRGWVNDQADILGVIDRQLGDSRIFSFGIGHLVNGCLLERIAKLGRCAVAYIGHHGSAEVMDSFLERVSHPAMTDINIDWGAMEVSDVYPELVRNLFVGRPAVLTGRFRGSGSATVRISGKVGDRVHEIAIPVKLDTPGAGHKGLPLVWARMKIADLVDQAKLYPDRERPEEIRDLALEYGLVSEYTEFIAVDSLSRTKGSHETIAAREPDVQAIIIRERPDPNSPALGGVRKGVQFDSTEKLGDWTKVKLGSLEGWVLTADIERSVEESK